MFDDKILILSQSRSGGSNLQYCLQAAINKGEIVGEHLKNRDEEEYENIEGILQDKFDEGFIGLKHNITNIEHLDHDKWLEYDKKVIDLFDRVVINDRKNWLKWGISFELAYRLNEFSFEGKEENKEEYYKRIENTESWEISPRQLKMRIDRYRAHWFKLIRHIENKEMPHTYITYENFYGLDGIAPKIDRLVHVLDFLDQEYNYEHQGTIERLLDPKLKMGGKKNMSLISNLDRVNRRLGPKFGYIY